MSPLNQSISQRIICLLALASSLAFTQAAPVTLGLNRSSSFYCAAASTATTTQNAPSIFPAEMLYQTIQEIQNTKSILSLHNSLKDDSAFEQFLSTINKSLSPFEQSPITPISILELGTSLRTANLSLQAEVASITPWIEINKILNPKADNYIVIPDRFVSHQAYLYQIDAPPTPADLDLWSELDTYNS